MTSHEYRVVPAPRRGVKVKGVRTPEDRFARAVEAEMNRMAAEGWEFVRSDTLPCEQRSGWFSRAATVFQTLLVFRRAVAQPGVRAEPKAAMPPPVALTPPASVAPPAPAASRFTPLPTAPLPANSAAPAAPAPTLALVAEPPLRADLPGLTVVGDLGQGMDAPAAPPGPGPRHAAE